jgi:hypothetical protein
VEAEALHCLGSGYEAHLAAHDDDALLLLALQKSLPQCSEQHETLALEGELWSSRRGAPLR